MELMIVVALAAVILAIGVPNFRDFQRNNRLTVSSNDMLGLAMSARNEALRRQNVVSMCPSANPTSAGATCGAGSGWIAFLDTNSDCTRAAGEELITNAVIATDVDAASNGTCISFASNGFKRVVAGQPTTHHFMYCDSRGNTERTPGSGISTARGVEVLPTGRSSSAKLIAELTAWDAGVNPVSCP